MNIGARREDRTRRHYRSISKSQATELLAWAKYFTEPAFPGRQAEESSTPDRGMVISAGRRCVQSNLSVAGGFIGSCVSCFFPQNRQREAEIIPLTLGPVLTGVNAIFQFRQLEPLRRQH